MGRRELRSSPSCPSWPGPLARGLREKVAAQLGGAPENAAAHAFDGTAQTIPPVLPGP